MIKLKDAVMFYIFMVLAFFIFALTICVYMSNHTPEPIIQTIISENRVEVVKEIPVVKERIIGIEVIREVGIPRVPETMLTVEEKILMAKLIHAEAGWEDYIGKRLVADVILNRVDAPGFGDTVTEVIRKPGQFTHPAGTYTEEDLMAVEAECYERLDYGILYFRAHYFFGDHAQAYQHGNHYFSY